MKSLKDQLKGDTEYLRYKQILATVQGSLDLEKTLREAKLLHRDRTSRTLYDKRVSPARLQEAVLKDMSNRSRLTELKALILNQQELLTTAISMTKKHIRVTYPDVLSQFGSTKEAQVLVAERILSKGMETLAQVSGAIEIIDLYVKDIDQSSYGLRNTLDTLKLILDRKTDAV